MVHGGLGLRQLWLLLMLSTNPWADRDGSGTVGKLSSTAVRCWARPGDSSRPGHCTARAGHAQAPGRWRWQWQSRWFDCLAWRGVAWRAARLKTRGVHSPDGTRRLRAANAGLPGQWSARWRDCLACSCCSPADPWDCTAPSGHGGSRPQTPACPGCSPACRCNCLDWRAARL